MDREFRQLLRDYANDPSLIARIRRIYHSSGQPMPLNLLYAYVRFMLQSSYQVNKPGSIIFTSFYPEFRQQIEGYIVDILDNDFVIPDRFEGQDAADGYYYKGWDGRFESNQPITKHLDATSIRWGRAPVFQWALMCEDSTGPAIRSTTQFVNAGGGEQFGNLNILCEELQSNIRQETGSDLWEVRWSHGQDINENLSEMSEDEWQERLANWEGTDETETEYEQYIFEQTGVHVDHFSNTHGFFIWITHPINQSILDQIES